MSSTQVRRHVYSRSGHGLANLVCYFQRKEAGEGPHMQDAEEDKYE